MEKKRFYHTPNGDYIPDPEIGPMDRMLNWAEEECREGIFQRRDKILRSWGFCFETAPAAKIIAAYNQAVDDIS